MSDNPSGTTPSKYGSARDLVRIWLRDNAYYSGLDTLSIEALVLMIEDHVADSTGHNVKLIQDLHAQTHRCIPYARRYNTQGVESHSGDRGVVPPGAE